MGGVVAKIKLEVSYPKPYLWMYHGAKRTCKEGSVE